MTVLLEYIDVWYLPSQTLSQYLVTLVQIMVTVLLSLATLPIIQAKLNVFSYLLCLKFCWHNWQTPTGKTNDDCSVRIFCCVDNVKTLLHPRHTT